MPRRLHHEQSQHPRGADDDQSDEGPERLNQNERHRLRGLAGLDEELDDQADAVPEHKDDEQHDDLEEEDKG